MSSMSTWHEVFALLAGSWSTTVSSIGAFGAEAGRDWHSSLSKWHEQRVCSGTLPTAIWAVDGRLLQDMENAWNALRSCDLECR